MIPSLVILVVCYEIDLPHCTDGYLMKENLELVFENPQNTGKETIEDMYITADMTRAVITYKTPKGKES